jgi:hypothetical protein
MILRQVVTVIAQFKGAIAGEKQLFGLVAGHVLRPGKS